MKGVEKTEPIHGAVRADLKLTQSGKVGVEWKEVWMEEDSSQEERGYSKEKAGKMAVQHKDNHSTLFPVSHTGFILPVVLRTN